MKRLVVVLGLVVGLVACGGSGLPPSSSVVASVTPAQATVQAGGTVTITGSATGFTDKPLVMWWINESNTNNTYSGCGKLDTQAKDFTGCPYGFVMFHDVLEFPSVATYYAPQTAGTYHVTFRAFQMSYSTYDTLEKTATATITVTP